MYKEFDFYDKTNLKSYNLNESMRYQLNRLAQLDVFTLKHSENVANMTAKLCKKLRLNKRFTTYCTMCAYLHDIGKMFIPSEILQKNGKLTEEEYEKMKTHTTIGYKMCMDDLKLRPYAEGALSHHEALDGSGYPNGVVKEDLPYEAQIIRVADEYDAIVSKRQYKTHIDISDTLKMLAAETIPAYKTGRTDAKKPEYSQMNPQIVQALLEVVEEDVNYEISCVKGYVKHLEEQIQRLGKLPEYIEGYNSAITPRDKKDYKEMIDYTLKKGENLDNYAKILQEYKEAYVVKKAHIEKLKSEIEKIRNIEVDNWLN